MSNNDQEQNAPILDFLYKDPDKVPSFYAQLCGGVLAETVRSTETGKEGEKKGNVGPSFLGLSYGKSNSEAISQSFTRNPHDSMAVELIYHLYEKGFIDHDAKRARSGCFVEVTGSCFFSDLNAMKLARYMAEQNKHTQKTVFEAVFDDAEGKRIIHISKMLETLGTPSIIQCDVKIM